MKTLAFVVCCKESNYIYDCVRSINNIYQNIADIIIVDSCSSDKKYFELSNEFPNVFIEDISNMNYEYGSILHGFTKYNQYEKYVFIQDSLRINSIITEIETILDNEVYLFGDSAINTGWSLDIPAKQYFYERNPKFPIMEGNFLICQWNSFLISKIAFNKVISSEIFHAAEPIQNNILQSAWERVWSIMFSANTVDRKIINTQCYTKVSGNPQ